MIGGFPLSTNHIKLKFMEVNLWNFSIVRLLLCRLSLWASAVRCAFGAASTFWKVTVRIIRPAMLMYGKEASNRKQEIDRQHYTIPNQRPKDKHFEKI